MEYYHQDNMLIDDFTMSQEIDNTTPSDIIFPDQFSLQNPWNNVSPSFHQPQDFHPFFDHQQCFPNYPYQEDLDSLAPFFDTYRDPLLDHFPDDDFIFLENSIPIENSGSKPPAAGPTAATSSGSTGGRKTSAGKLKRAEGQPSKNLMAERRRRKRLNDRLALLRSIVPKISKMDRTSILGDTIDYVKELTEKIRNLEASYGISGVFEDRHINSIAEFLNQKEMLMMPADESHVTNPSKFEVERRKGDTKVEMRCAPKPGILMATLGTMEALGLEINQCVISCFSDFSMHASCDEVGEHGIPVSEEVVKQALFRNAGYGGRCI